MINNNINIENYKCNVKKKNNQIKIKLLILIIHFY
jgi:hypothetical protein